METRLRTMAKAEEIDDFITRGLGTHRGKAENGDEYGESKTVHTLLPYKK
jgi:hypothetical protein